MPRRRARRREPWDYRDRPVTPRTWGAVVEAYCERRVEDVARGGTGLINTVAWMTNGMVAVVHLTAATAACFGRMLAEEPFRYELDPDWTNLELVGGTDETRERCHHKLLFALGLSSNRADAADG